MKTRGTNENIPIRRQRSKTVIHYSHRSEHESALLHTAGEGRTVTIWYGEQ